MSDPVAWRFRWADEEAVEWEIVESDPLRCPCAGEGDRGYRISLLGTQLALERLRRR